MKPFTPHICFFFILFPVCYACYLLIWSLYFYFTLIQLSSHPVIEFRVLGLKAGNLRPVSEALSLVSLRSFLVNNQWNAQVLRPDHGIIFILPETWMPAISYFCCLFHTFLKKKLNSILLVVCCHWTLSFLAYSAY